MTREEITRMAQEAGFVGFDGENKCLREFAALVAASEREACAKVCEEQKLKYEQRAVAPEEFRDINPEVARIAAMTCDFNAASIRARGQT